MGKWMLTKKDPKAELPPDPMPVHCPQQSWDFLIGESDGYFNNLSMTDPVGIPSGNFILPEIDLTLNSRFPLVLARIYNSLDPQVGPFGRGWSTPFTSHLEFVASDIAFVNSDGSRILFAKTNDQFKAPDWSELRLSYATDTAYWSVSHPNGAEWTFNDKGKIIRMSRACCGMGAIDALLFDYDGSDRLTRVSNPVGLFLDFSYNTNNRIISVVDSTSRTLSYGYDSKGNLTSFTDPIGRTTLYTYSQDDFMVTVTKPGNRVTSVTYIDRRVSSVTSPDGAVSMFTWDYDNHKLTITDPVGTNHEYGFTANWHLVSYSIPSMGISKQFVSSGSALVEMADALGNNSHYSYGSDGLVNSITDALGNTTTYTWDPTFHKLTNKIDSLGREWRYIWCYRGNLWSEIDPIGGVTSYTYDAFNNRTSKTDPLGRVTRFVYDSLGNRLVQVIDALGGISSFSYDMRGNLISSSDPLGRTSNFEYDLMNRLTKTVYPDGRFITLEYDLAGNVVLKRDNLSRETGFMYDLSGRILTTTRPDGTVISSLYDSAGRKVSEIDSLSRVTRFEYNSNGLLVKTIYPDNTFETFSYDSEGRLTSKTNELEQTANFEYDPLGRLLCTIDPTGARWESQYDAVGRKIADKDPLNRVTAYQFDNLDRITKVIKPDNSFVTNSFDAVGNLLSTVDALGNNWSWVYDNLNRQVKAIQPNGANSMTTFDAAGQPIAEADALGRITQYSFDLGGRKTATTDALGNVWRNNYDNAGRLVSSVNPLGAVSSMTYDIMDRVVSQSDPLGNVTSFEFDNAGRRIAKTDAMGRRSITAYDLRDRITSEADPEGHTVSFGYNLAGQRIRLTDGANRTWHWEYDSLGRVVSEIDPLGNTNRYGFDSVSNRTIWTNARNQATNYTFDTMNRLFQVNYPDGTVATLTYDLEGRELSRSGPAGCVTKTYDSVGNMTSEAFSVVGAPLAAPKKWQYSFDPTGNRIGAIDPEGKVFKYRFDALNRMVELDPPEKGDKIKFSFDSAGKLITEERPSVKTTNIFDLAGRLLQVKHKRDHGPEKIVASRNYQYNSVGNRITEQSEAGEITKYSFNGSDWLTKVQYPHGRQVSYSYNGAGDRLTELSETPTIEGHGHNTHPATITVTLNFGYDLAGRMISRASDTFVFDPDGNLTVEALLAAPGCLPEESRYFWSSDNRLVKVEKDIECPKHGKKKCHQCPQTFTLAEEYSYLPESWKRITRKTGDQTFVSIYDGNDEALEYQLKTHKDKKEHDCICRCSNHRRPHLNLIHEFIGGPGTDDLVTTKYHGRTLEMLKDGLGSTIALTNKAGHAVSRMNYDAWGNLRFPDKPGYGVAPCKEGDLDNILDNLEGKYSFGEPNHDGYHYGRHFAKVLTPFLFQGRRWDGFSQTYNHRHRQYNPKYGRWLSRDPIGFFGGRNLWNFVNNNPLRFTDPWGLLELITNSQGYFLIDDWGNWKRVSQKDAEDLEKSLCIEAKQQEFVRLSQSGDQFFFTGKELFKAWLMAAFTEWQLPQNTLQGLMRSNQPSTTKLYRAVSVEEYNQILSTGKFEVKGGAEGKYFAESPTDASTWGSKMMGTGNFRIIEAEFPSDASNQFYRWDRLDGIGPARFGEMNQLKDAKIKPFQ